MINVNPGNGVKDVVDVFINPGSGVKTCDAVWENVGGNLYQVWPVAHTAYDGSTFKGALKDGLTSGFSMYMKRYSNDTAASRVIYNDGIQYYPGTANASCTSGIAYLSVDYEDDMRSADYIGWRSKNLVNISLYDSITIATERISGAWEDEHFLPGICLMNSAGTSATFVTATVDDVTYDSTNEVRGVCDVSGITGQYYVLFVFRYYFTETSTKQHRNPKRKISSIAFA